MQLIKPVASYIATPLTIIVSPIPKIRMLEQLSDYRPISVLPILSKIYEKLVMKQIEYI